MATYRAIVLDLDDTLYPEHQYVRSGFHAVARYLETEAGLSAEETFAQLIALLEAGVREMTMNRWLQDRQLDEQRWIGPMLRCYREHDPQIELSSEATEVLETLHGRYALGLVSDGRLAQQQKKVAALGIDRWISAIVLSDAFGREHWKPSTRPFEEVLGQLGVSGESAVYVADNPTKDFLGARQLGMSTIRLRRAGGLYSHLEPPTEAHAPQAEIATLAELPARLDSRS